MARPPPIVDRDASPRARLDNADDDADAELLNGLVHEILVEDRKKSYKKLVASLLKTCEARRKRIDELERTIALLHAQVYELESTRNWLASDVLLRLNDVSARLDRIPGAEKTDPKT